MSYNRLRKQQQQLWCEESSEDARYHSGSTVKMVSSSLLGDTDDGGNMHVWLNLHFGAAKYHTIILRELMSFSYFVPAQLW